jgi:hypothetical protein
MQLQYSGHSDVVVLVKTPEFFCKSVKPGELLDVSEELGHAILAKHAQLFAVLKSEAKRRKVELVEKDVKLRKKAK